MNPDHSYTFNPMTDRKLILSIILISMISVVCVYFTEMPDNVHRNLDGTFASSAELKMMSYRGILLSMPMLGLILGSTISIIPFKRLGYKQKWKRFVLVSILVFAFISFLSVTITLIKYLFGV